MLNFKEIINKIEKYKVNISKLDIILKDLYDLDNILEIKNFDDKTFTYIDEQLNKNNLFWYENMLFDKNIYNNIINYENYIKKIIDNINQNVLNSIDFETHNDNYLLNITQNIINYYLDDIKFNLKEIETIDMEYYHKINNINITYNLGTFYNKTNDNINNYIVKDEIKNNISEIVTGINLITDKNKLLEKDFNKIDNNFIEIIQQIKYNDYPYLVINDNLMKGGNSDFTNEHNIIKKTLFKQKEIIYKIELIKKRNMDNIKYLYDLYYFTLFIINKLQTKSYSLFAFKNIPFELIDKYYKRILEIKKLDKYEIIIKIIDNYLKKNKDKLNIESNNINNIKFIVLFDKFNIIFRQSNEKLINSKIKLNFNDYDIFLIGNRKLVDKFYVFYDLSNLKIIDNIDYIKKIGRLLYYYNLSNIYLIENIDIISTDIIRIWKYSDLLFKISENLNYTELNKFKDKIMQIELKINNYNQFFIHKDYIEYYNLDEINYIMIEFY